MITDALLDFLFDALTWLVELLPVDTLDLSGITDFTSSFAGTAGAFMDVGALSTALGIMAAGELALLGVRLTVFVIRLIP